MSTWKQHSATQTIQAHRTGWAGVLDAIKAAITRKPRMAVPVTVTFSVMVKSDVPVRIGITQANIEVQS